MIPINPNLLKDTCDRIEKKFDMSVYKPFQSGDAGCIAYNICLAAGADVNGIQYNEIPHIARDIWAARYGKEEADRLEFDEKGWGDNISEVTPEEAIAHLRGANPVVHSTYPDDS